MTSCCFQCLHPSPVVPNSDRLIAPTLHTNDNKHARTQAQPAPRTQQSSTRQPWQRARASAKERSAEPCDARCLADATPGREPPRRAAASRRRLRRPPCTAADHTLSSLSYTLADQLCHRPTRTVEWLEGHRGLARPGAPAAGLRMLHAHTRALCRGRAGPVHRVSGAACREERGEAEKLRMRNGNDKASRLLMLTC